MVNFPSFSMHVLPRCHKNGVWEHSASVDFHIDYGMVDIPDPAKVTMVMCISVLQIIMFRLYPLSYHQVMHFYLMDNYPITHPRTVPLIKC